MHVSTACRSVLVTVVVVACRGQPQRLAPSGIEPDYAIYSAIIAAQHSAVVVRDSTNAFRACSTGKPCWLDAIPPEFQPAAADYLSRNAARIELQPRFASEVTAHLDRDWKGPPVTGCRDVPRITFSRVGIAPGNTRAIVSYEVRVGRGPYPGCGYASGAMVGLRRTPDGRWVVAQTFSLWET